MKSTPTFGLPARAAALAALAALALGSTPAWSQSTRSSMGQEPLPSEPTAVGYNSGPTVSDVRYSWLPYTTSGYVGGAVGAGKVDTTCVAGQTCEDPDTSGKVYTGGMFNPFLGVELGFVQWADAARNGGNVSARGVNAMLTGFVPLGTMFTLVGKVGTTYGWTKTTLGPGVVAPSGSVNGFGLAYGAGASFELNRNWSITLDWERHNLKFKNNDRQDVDLTSLGLKYRF
ncbi:MAG: porin family protein [Rubrivivax sp.]|nr:MAG: porin family protein [Rubrivivax sp.]